MALVTKGVCVELLRDSSGEEEELSPPRPARQLPPAEPAAQAGATPGRFAQLSQHIHTVYKMARSGTRRRNATVSTPAAAGKSAPAARNASAAPGTADAAAAGSAKAAVQAADRAARSQRRKVQTGTPKAATAEQAAPAAAAAAKQATAAKKGGRKRAAAAVHSPAGKENLPQAPAPADERAAAAGASPSKRQRREPAPAPAPAATQQQPRAEAAPASPLQAAAPPRAPPQAVQGQPAEAVRAAPQWEQSLTSVGPQPSESLHDSILKSPTPPKRAKRTASTAAGGLPALAALGAAPPAAQPAPAAPVAAAAEPGAVDQPAAAQQQQPLAAALGPATAAAQPEAQQAQQAEAAAERVGSTPTPAANRPRTSPAKRQRQQQEEPGGGAGPSAAAAAPLPSPRRQSPRLQASPGDSAAAGCPPEVVASTPAAKPPGAAAEAADAWWDPLDPDKVNTVRAALHVGSYCKGSVPLCREAQAERVGWWLARQLAAGSGGSIYLSGLPGTGKSLTAHEVVRQCWRAPPVEGAAPPPPGAPPTAAPSLDPPPALLSINCASLKGPVQVAERILLGFEQACRAPHPAAAMAAGLDPIQYPSEAAAGNAEGGGDGPGVGKQRARRRSGGGDPLLRLRRLALSPVADVDAVGGEPTPAAGPAKGKGGKGGKGKARGKRKSRGSQPEAGTGSAGAGRRGMLVVVLDELDMLLAGPKGSEVVEHLFVLAAAPASRLLLLGIANSIDLVPRLLRPGGALHRHNLHPAHEQFPAYTKQHFSQVLHQRLACLPGRVFAPAAIELCSRKMANASGDMRVALTACERAVAAVVSEATAAAAEADLDAAEAAAMADAGLGPALGGTSCRRGGSDGEGEAAAQRQRSWLVGLPQMAATLAAITGGIGLGNDNVRAIRALPPQQKLLLCTLGKLGGELLNNRGMKVRSAAATPGGSRGTPGGRAGLMSPAGSAASSRKSGSLLSGGSGASSVQRSREVHLGQLKEAFTQLCRQVGLEPYTDIECGTACEALEDRGLLRLAEARGAAGRLVTLRVPEEDVLLALSDVPVLRGVVGAGDGAVASSAP